MGLQQNKTAPPATSDRSVDDLFVIAYQIYALVLGLLIRNRVHELYSEGAD